MAVWKGRKKCVIGKNCGGSCINRQRVCRVELRPSYQELLKQVAGKLSKQGGGITDQLKAELKAAGFKTNVAEDMAALARRLAKVENLKPVADLTNQPLSGKGLESLKNERERLIGRQGPEINVRRAELAEKIARANNAKVKIAAEEDALKALQKQRLEKVNEFEALPSGSRKLELRGEIDAINKKLMKQAGFGSETKPAGLETQLAKAKEDFASVAARQMALIKEGKTDEALKLNVEMKPAASLVRKLAYKIDLQKAGIKGSSDSSPSVSWKTKGAKQSAVAFDDKMLSKTLDKVGDPVSWNETTKTGAKALGTGSFGTVIRTPDGKVAHKRGDIGEEEAALIKKVGEAGLGPKFLGAELNGPGKNGHGTRLGRLAMEALDGKPLGEREPNSKVAGRNAADIYWETRAAVHRLGIQHNDMHHNNILVDKNGKGKIIDMGLAKDSPKAALSEALGALSKDGGDWQATRWHSTGGQLLEDLHNGSRTFEGLAKKAPLLAKTISNKAKVEKEMLKMGLSLSDVDKIGSTEIRSDSKVYSSGPFAKISNEQAMRLINMLYDGV